MKTSVGIRHSPSLFLIGSLLTLSDCHKDENAVPKTITDQILADEQFSLLRVMVQQAEAGDALRGANLTLFAPNDAAFQKVGITTEASIKKLTKEQLRIILFHHLLNARSPLASIPTGLNEVEMADQRHAYLNKTNTGKLYIDNAQVT
ncbi:MAG: fasciclin domain-containing protein [Spirosoma sp.]|nr:fasciclin domain-containing protein [Spirosoma sp.]